MTMPASVAAVRRTSSAAPARRAANTASASANIVARSAPAKASVRRKRMVSIGPARGGARYSRTT